PEVMLTPDRKPELSGGAFPDACITTDSSFSEWYRDVGSNAQVVDSIVLYANGNGGYVNRYGDNGEPYITTIDTGEEQGGYGNSAATCAAAATQRTGDRQPGVAVGPKD